MSKPIGTVTHFFDKISVMIVKVSLPIKVGDVVRVVGHGREFVQKINSMQVDHEVITHATKGKEVGIKVTKPAKEGDLLYATDVIKKTVKKTMKKPTKKTVKKKSARKKRR